MTPLLLVALIAGADPAAPRPRDWPGSIPPSAVDRVNDWLKKSRPPGASQDALVQKVLDLVRQYPNMSGQEIAKRAQTDIPELSDPAKLEDVLESLRGRVGMPSTPSMEMPPTLPSGPGVSGPGPSGTPVDPQDLPPQLRNPPGVDFPRPNPPVEPELNPRPHFPPPDGRRHDHPPSTSPEGRWFRKRSGFGHGPDPLGSMYDGPTSFEDQARRNRTLRTMISAWEKHFGPVRDNPALRQMMLDLVAGADGNGLGDNKALSDLLANPGEDGKAFADWLENRMNDGQPLTPPDAQPTDPRWNLSEWGLGDFKFGKSELGLGTPSIPKSSGWSLFSSNSSSGESSWLSVVLFIATAAGALLLWRFWPQIAGKVRHQEPQPLPGLGPWPVDPRQIDDRDSLVKAFEYLSVLVCGTGSRVWNHLTIAAALRRTAPSAEDAAEPLARLYALARYAPADEPIPPAALHEARTHLSRLAGVAAQ